MPVNVLVCDDDPFLLELVEFRLGVEGYSVKTVESGTEALSILDSFTPDIMVLDCMMPGLDGLEILVRVREMPMYQNTPILMLSARNREQDIVSALRKGADDYIIKPFIPDELCARIEKQLQLHRIDRSAA